MGRGTARSSNQAPNNAIQTKQKAHKQELTNVNKTQHKTHNA